MATGWECFDTPPIRSADFTLVPSTLIKPFKVHAAADLEIHTGALWWVSTATLTPTEIEGHCKSLTCVPNEGKSSNKLYGPPKPFFIGYVSCERLYMPPHYAIQAFPNAVVATTELTTGEEMRPEAVFTGELWDTYPPQKQAVDAWSTWRSEHSKCPPAMISLPCGHGKSVICLAIASTVVRRVTLVLVHMKGLVDQWIAEAKRYIPGSRVGYIKAERQRVDGVDIIIASMQALHSHMKVDKEYLHVLKRRVGFVILDEAHHGVANTFQKVIAYIPAADRLAVTATPRRQDGLFEELQFIFGPVVFRSFRRPGDGQVIMLNYINPAIVERKQWGTVQKYLMEADLIADYNRTMIGVHIAAMLATEQRRRILILTSQVIHVKELHSLLVTALEAHSDTLMRRVTMFVPDPTPHKRRKRKEESVEEAQALAEACMQAYEDSGPHGKHTEIYVPLVGMVTSDMDPFTRQLNYEAAVVVATTDIMKEGISYNLWDTLIDMDDGVDPEQMVGRIQRAGDKKVPLVIDMFTKVSMFWGMSEKRRNFYNGEEFAVHNISITGKDDMPAKSFWDIFNRKATSIL
jgi:hypothetical protein